MGDALVSQNKTAAQMITSDVDCARLIMDGNEAISVSDYQMHRVKRWKRGEKGKRTILLSFSLIKVNH